MSNKALKITNNITELILAFAFVSILTLSTFASASILVKPGTDKNVLGASSTKTQFKFYNNADTNTDIKFVDLKDQYTLNFRFNPKGDTDESIDIGELFGSNQGGDVYRLTANVPEYYKNDVDLFIILNGKRHPVLTQGQLFVNTITIPQGESYKMSLDIAYNKEIYYKVDASIILYK